MTECSDALGKLHAIDVHRRVCLPVHAAKMSRACGFFPALQDWISEKSVDDMDRGGVATAIVSITDSGLWFVDVAEARRLSRICNKYGATLVDENRGRFGFFAASQFPDADEANPQPRRGDCLIPENGERKIDLRGDRAASLPVVRRKVSAVWSIQAKYPSATFSEGP